MFFLNLLFFIIFTMQSSSDHLKWVVEHDISNPYGGKSFPSLTEIKIRVCFNMLGFYSNPAPPIITIDDKTKDKLFTTQNALNEIIYSKIGDLPAHSLVYLDIPSITDINPQKCGILENRHAIDLVEKIKELNTNNTFEIEDKQILDPFRLADNIKAYKKVRSERIFMQSYRYSFVLTAAVTILSVGFSTNRISPLIPVIAFFPPFLCNFKYIKHFIKNFPDIENLGLSGCKKTITVTSFFFVVPIILIYGVAIGLHKLKTLF